MDPSRLPPELFDKIIHSTAKGNDPALTVAIVLTFRRGKRQWMCPGDSIGM